MANVVFSCPVQCHRRYTVLLLLQREGVANVVFSKKVSCVQNYLNRVKFDFFINDCENLLRMI